MKLIQTIEGYKGKWEIYQYPVKGVKRFGNRLIANNGNILCGNKGFNTKASALKNMRAVIATC